MSAPRRSAPRARLPRQAFDRLVAAPAALAELIERQHGVATRSQLAAVGIGPQTVATAVGALRWQTIGRNVTVLHNAALTREQRLWVACLAPGKPAAICAITALMTDGLKGFDDDGIVHVVVAEDCNAAVPSWIRLHNSRRFTPLDINQQAGVPRTRIARSTIDAAAWSPSPRRAATLLCAAVQQRLTTGSALSDELRAAGHVRHSADLREILVEISAGAHTITEADIGALAARAGLGTPRRQAGFRDLSGRQRYSDAEFDLPDGTLLAVEIDGIHHLDVLRQADDLSRQNDAVLGGRLVLRFASLTVRYDPELVVDRLRRVRLAHS